MKKQVKNKLSLKTKPWLNELFRDLLAIGSIPMFIIVAIRVTIGEYYGYLYQILLAGVILFILTLLIKSQNHVARTIILYFFTIKYYEDEIFTNFATVLLILILISVFYLRYPKKQIFFGILWGIISTTLSYYILNPYFPIKVTSSL